MQGKKGKLKVKGLETKEKQHHISPLPVGKRMRLKVKRKASVTIAGSQGIKSVNAAKGLQKKRKRAQNLRLMLQLQILMQVRSKKLQTILTLLRMMMIMMRSGYLW